MSFEKYIENLRGMYIFCISIDSTTIKIKYAPTKDNAFKCEYNILMINLNPNNETDGCFCEFRYYQTKLSVLGICKKACVCEDVYYNTTNTEDQFKAAYRLTNICMPLKTYTCVQLLNIMCKNGHIQIVIFDTTDIIYSDKDHKEHMKSKITVYQNSVYDY